MHPDAGQVSWKREQIKRGIESDQCYYFDLAKMEVAGRAAANLSDKVADYPNPYLAKIQSRNSPSKINRPGIYAALKVQELRRVREGKASIEKLTPKGASTPIASSGYVSAVRRHSQVDF